MFINFIGHSEGLKWQTFDFSYFLYLNTLYFINFSLMF